MNITKEIFLETAFPSHFLAPNALPVIAYPDSFVGSDGQQVDYYRQLHPQYRLMRAQRSWYFCVSSVVHQRKRQVKKRLEDVVEAHVLVVDDVGTKSRRPPVTPSYKLETSHGNFQYGYLIDPYDVSTPAGQAYYDSCLMSLAAAGMNDPGFRSASRLARLPGSLHRTGWQAEITHWRPERGWALEDLMDCMGIDMITPDTRPAGSLVAGEHTRLETVRDAIYDVLVAEDMVLGHNSRWVHLRCPWQDQHTDGLQGYSSTSYSPDGYGTAGRSFKCLHGHCAGRTTADFVTWITQHRNTNLFYGVERDV